MKHKSNICLMYMTVIDLQCFNGSVILETLSCAKECEISIRSDHVYVNYVIMYVVACVISNYFSR